MDELMVHHTQAVIKKNKQHELLLVFYDLQTFLLG